MKNSTDNEIKVYKLNNELDWGKIAYLKPSSKHGLIWTKIIYDDKQTVWNYNTSKIVYKLDNQTITYDYASQYWNRIISGWRLPTLDEALHCAYF